MLINFFKGSLFLILLMGQIQLVAASENQSFPAEIEQLVLEDLYNEGLITEQKFLFEQQNLPNYSPIKANNLSTYTVKVGTGSIAGQITDNNIPVNLHIVNLYNINNLSNPVATIQTDNLGNFLFDDLDDGDYIVFTGTNGDGYLHYVWQNLVAGGPRLCHQCNLTVTADSYIAVGAGIAVTGIDFTIEVGGVISGFITDASTLAGVASMNVRAVNINDNYYNLKFQFILLDANTGEYQVLGIPNGTYKLFLESRFDLDNEYIPQLYGDSQCNICASLAFDDQGTDFVIDTLNTISNVNFNVNKGASISGKIVDAVTGNSLAQYGFLLVFNELNQVITRHLVYGTNTVPLATGDYFIGGLLPGSYYIQGGDMGFEFYQREVYANKPCYWSGCDRSTGDVIVLGDKEQVESVDFLLEKGGKITGTITDAVSGFPISIANDQVQFYAANGEVVGGARAKNDGTYISARGLPTGDYAVRTGNMFSGILTNPYVDEKYNDIECSGLACDLTTADVNIVGETTVENIDFALDIGLVFSGMITEAGTTTPIPNVHVLIYKDMGPGLEPEFANWTTTSDGSSGAIGSFEITGLPAGTYYAVTNNGSNLPFMGFRPTPGAGWVDILYDGIACPAGGCDLTLGTPIVLANIRGITPTFNMSLNSGASISGKIIDTKLNAPIADIKVNVFNQKGDSFGSFTTNSSGYYRTAGLAAGAYYLTTSSFDVLVDVKYGNAPCLIDTCNANDAIPVVLNALESKENIDFILTPDFIFSNGVDSE